MRFHGLDEEIIACKRDLQLFKIASAQSRLKQKVNLMKRKLYMASLYNEHKSIMKIREDFRNIIISLPEINDNIDILPFSKCLEVLLSRAMHFNLIQYRQLELLKRNCTEFIQHMKVTFWDIEEDHQYIKSVIQNQIDSLDSESYEIMRVKIYIVIFQERMIKGSVTVIHDLKADQNEGIIKGKSSDTKFQLSHTSVVSSALEMLTYLHRNNTKTQEGVVAHYPSQSKFDASKDTLPVPKPNWTPLQNTTTSAGA
jgi:hypothetical protein